jgi:hypothetical protein
VPYVCKVCVVCIAVVLNSTVSVWSGRRYTKKLSYSSFYFSAALLIDHCHTDKANNVIISVLWQVICNNMQMPAVSSAAWDNTGVDTSLVKVGLAIGILGRIWQ